MERFLLNRPKRLRYNANLRQVIRDTTLKLDDFILPLFIKHGNNIKLPIDSMPGHFQLSIDRLKPEIDEILELGIMTVILFGIPESKDCHGSDPLTLDGIIPRAIMEIKKLAPELLVIADVCMCEYTDHGHCGVMNNNELDNDQTLPLIAKQATVYAKAGADIIAPSGMIDGAVYAIRKLLDASGFINTPILGYSIKYASSLYGPFRMAAEGAPKYGDRKSYQADYANKNEALKEVECDIAEGVDMVMVKPAHAYLDIIFKVKQSYPEVPLVAYHTSGEYAMIKAASHNGWIDEREAMLEIMTAIKRAGADLIITYYAKEIAKLLV